MEELGFQQLEKIQTNNKFALFSTFEYGRVNKKELENVPHVLVSNSLAIKRDWLKLFGGTEYLPTEARKGKSKDNEPVLIIGSEILNPGLWEQALAYLQESE